MCDPSAKLQELLKTRNGVREAVEIARAEIAEHAGAGSAAGLYSSALFNLLLETLIRADQAGTTIEELETKLDHYAAEVEQVRARAEARIRAADYSAEKVRQDVESQNYEREKLLKDLDRARSWGNTYEEGRILDRLRSL